MAKFIPTKVVTSNPSPGPVPVGGGPLPEKAVVGTSSGSAGVVGQSNTGPGVLAESLYAASVPNSGLSDGVRGISFGNGVHGISRSASESGVWGESTGGGFGVSGSTSSESTSGVWGANSGAGFGVVGTSDKADGVLGQGANGVIGLAGGASQPVGVNNGVVGATTTGSDSGVWGFNSGAGQGVTGQSTHGVGVLGQGAGNGVHGHTSSDTDSGVWGTNGGKGYGVTGTSTNGIGVLGQGAGNGVHGHTSSDTDSGVWGTNGGKGYGVTGTSTNGIGVLGQGGALAGRFEGDVEVTGDIRLSNMDCAEDFDVMCGEIIDPGTVMVIAPDGTLRVSQSAYDNRVAGVVSGAGEFRPGIVLGRLESRENRLPIALVGKVYCKVDAGYSAIDVGDLLTSSPTPGHAMKADDRVKAFGAVLGKALSPLRDGQGLIPVLVALQ